MLQVCGIFIFLFVQKKDRNCYCTRQNESRVILKLNCFENKKALLLLQRELLLANIAHFECAVETSLFCATWRQTKEDVQLLKKIWCMPLVFLFETYAMKQHLLLRWAYYLVLKRIENALCSWMRSGSSVHFNCSIIIRNCSSQQTAPTCIELSHQIRNRCWMQCS